MGTAPPPDQQLEDGQPLGAVSTGPPNINGGNMDNRHMGGARQLFSILDHGLIRLCCILCFTDAECDTVGATLYFPIFVPGALFSCGDGHAAQGDGEVAGTAIETAIYCKMRLTVIKSGSGGPVSLKSHGIDQHDDCERFDKSCQPFCMTGRSVATILDTGSPAALSARPTVWNDWHCEFSTGGCPTGGWVSRERRSNRMNEH